MSEFEDRMRDALRGAEAPADETFVRLVDTRVETHERRRVIGLVLAAAAAIALIVLIAIGVVIALPDLLAGPGGSLPALSTQPFLLLGQAVPVAGLLLLAALVYPFARLRR